MKERSKIIDIGIPRCKIRPAQLEDRFRGPFNMRAHPWRYSLALQFSLPLVQHVCENIRSAAIPLAFMVLLKVAAFSQFVEVTRIHVGKQPMHALATQDGRIYVSNWGDGTIAVIDSREGRIKTTIPSVGIHPDGLAVSPDSRYVYVADHGDQNGNGGGIFVIDTASEKVVKFISTHANASDLALTPDGKKLYVPVGYAGLGKIDTTDWSFSIIDSTPCPVNAAVNPTGTKLYVTYQCAPSPGRDGHDPIFVFDTQTDTHVKTIARFKGGMPIANVGGPLAVSPRGDVIWVNGNDACSREDVYDFVGCEQTRPGEDIAGRGIVNVINATTDAAEFGRCFLGRLAGSGDPQGAAIPSFFPDGSKVIVSSNTRLLMFDPYNGNQIGEALEHQEGPGAVAFGGNHAYVTLSKLDSVEVLRYGPQPETSSWWQAYSALWHQDPFQTLSWHVATLLVLWSMVSLRFAKAFSRWPVVRIPLQLDAHLRKQHSRLISIYLHQLERNAQNRLKKRDIRIVSLPLIVNHSKGQSTSAWIDGFIQRLRSGGHHRVALKGPGGSGKTVLIYELTLRLVRKEFVPIVLQAAEFAGQQSLTDWVSSTLDSSPIRLTLTVIRALPNIVYVIDQVSEVPIAYQVALAKVLRQQFAAATEDVQMLVAGRSLDLAGTPPESDWDEIIEPGELDDKDIRRIGTAYLDPTGKSILIEELPQVVREQIMSKPTAFIVAHYAKARRDSSRPVSNADELFHEILDAYVGRGQLGTPPEIVQRVLESLVRRNFLQSRERGVPAEQALVDQVHEIIDQEQLVEKYGESNVPAASILVRGLLSSGLFYRANYRYLFFHDAFEDWLAEESGREARFGNM